MGSRVCPMTSITVDSNGARPGTLTAGCHSRPGPDGHDRPGPGLLRRSPQRWRLPVPRCGSSHRGHSAFGQFTEPSSGSSVGAPTIKTPLQKQSVTVNGEALIYDGAIDPNEYRIGPGDLLEM